MRKSRQEAAETRRRIVGAASQRFRENGIENTALADLMAEAGLTHGGFYKHFASKDQVVVESLQLATENARNTMSATLESAPGKRTPPSTTTCPRSTWAMPATTAPSSRWPASSRAAARKCARRPRPGWSR